MTLYEALQIARRKHACPTGKATHPSESAANVVAERLAERDERHGRARHGEAICGGWHIGRPRA